MTDRSMNMIFSIMLGNCCCEIIPTVRSTPRVSEDNMSRFTRSDDLCCMLEPNIEISA